MNETSAGPHSRYCCAVLLTLLPCTALTAGQQQHITGAATTKMPRETGLFGRIKAYFRREI